MNKTTQLYKVKENNVVVNNYILTFHNTQDQNLIFNVKLQDEKNYRIKRFESFSLEAGKKIKKVLIIETTENHIKIPNNTSDILIEISALDTKLKINKVLSFSHP